jgi:hypothetical protein
MLIDGTGAFTIDNAVAKALRDDYHRLGELVRKKCGDPLSAAEVEEESRLRARIGDRAKAIGCPAGYGLKQAQKDSNRLHQLYCKRISPPSCGGGALPDAEDAEEVQLRARVAAFDESPEGCARRRIRDLEMQDFRAGRSAAEQNELDNLRTLYPDLPLDPDDPLTEAFEAWRRVAAEGKAAASNVDRSRPRLSATPRCKQNLYSLSRGSSSPHARASSALSRTGPRLATVRRSSPHRAGLPVSQFPRSAYLRPGSW